MTDSAPAPRSESPPALGVRSSARAAGRALRVAGRFIAAGAKRFWTFSEPVLGVIGPVGWLVLLAAVASMVAGLLLGWPELTYLAATLFGALLVASLFLFGRANYAVTIELQPPRVVVGERALGSMKVTNTASRRSLPTRMELPVGRGVAEFTIPALPTGDQHEELFGVPTNRRAVIIAGPAATVRGDQVGLLRRTVKWTEPQELFVHPLTARLAPSATGLVRDLEGEITKTITSNDISFHALRAYQPGDPLRNVHWRTSARTGELMVRQFEETRRSQLLVLFSAEREYYADEDEFELAVSVMASVGVQVIRDGTKISVVSEDRMLHSATPTTLLDDSCRLEFVSDRYRSPRDFARETTKRLPAPSVLMLVTGSRMGIADFRAVGSLFSEDTRRIVLRIEPGAAPRMYTVSEVTIVTVGALSDLPRLIRTVQP